MNYKNLQTEEDKNTVLLLGEQDEYYLHNQQVWRHGMHS